MCPQPTIVYYFYIINIGEYIINSAGRSVHSFDLSKNQLGIKTCISMTRLLIKSKVTLMELNIAENDIRDSGLGILSEGVRASHSLRRLNVSGNSISDMGGNDLCDALQNFEKLTDLDMSWNQIKFCSPRFCDVRSILQLNLSFNPLGVDSKVSENLASRLEENTTLLHLEVN